MEGRITPMGMAMRHRLASLLLVASLTGALFCALYVREPVYGVLYYLGAPYLMGGSLGVMRDGLSGLNTPVLRGLYVHGRRLFVRVAGAYFVALMALYMLTGGYVDGLFQGYSGRASCPACNVLYLVVFYVVNVCSLYAVSVVVYFDDEDVPGAFRRASGLLSGNFFRTRLLFAASALAFGVRALIVDAPGCLLYPVGLAVSALLAYSMFALLVSNLVYLSGAGRGAGPT